MDLRRAANYFSDTTIQGWDGSAWVDTCVNCTLLPHDRFISEREFGNKRRYILVDPDTNVFDTYKVIRLAEMNLQYMVGVRNYDMRETAYSAVYLLHQAPCTGELMTFTKTMKASGMAGTAERSPAGTWYCDIERVTFSNSKEFDSIKFSEFSLILPADCPADTDNEFQVGESFFDIRESYMSAGFRYCRALEKRSA